MDKESYKKEGNKGFLTLFIIMSLSLVLAMSGVITSSITRISIQAVVLLLQLIIVKSFIDDYQKLRE